MGNPDIRVGKVSSVNQTNGMIKVTYADRDGAVTAELPCLNVNGEYRTPGIGESVLVAHLSNGSGRGVALGTMWNRNNCPPETGSDVYRKNMSSSGRAYQRYSESDGTFRLCTQNADISADNGIKCSAASMEVNIKAAFTLQGGKTAINTDELNAELKRALISAAENISIDSESVSVKAGRVLELEDQQWKTTLGSIMERIGALDGRTDGMK